MRRAMAAAEVGDDVYAEDPTLNALEEEVAAMFGHAAAMFVPSGTMGNQIALRLSCGPAEELLCDADAHIVTYEGGAAADHGGIQTRTLVADRGLLPVDALAAQIRVEGYHAVPTRLLAVEQTHNRGGGAIYPFEQLKELRGLADSYRLKVHCDGARIWNACVATGTSPAEYGGLFDTLSVCLSKGLGAPVGSLALMADADQLSHARALRRRLGGAMRQAGVLAAAGRYALTHNLDRLADDHRRAQRLAVACAEADPEVVDPATVQTNIVPLDLSRKAVDAATLAAHCRAEGVLVSTVAPRRVRLVTHLDVDDAGVERAVSALSRALR
jgi:threonine aldolase